MKRLLVLLMALLCTSCTALPSEERAFAVALCAEKQDGVWRVYARIPAYKAGGEYLTVSGKGTDIASALDEMNDAAPMQTSLSQLRLLVLSDRLAPEDVSALLTHMSAQYDVRQQCAIAVTDASANAAADALRPESGTRLSKAIDVLLEARTGQGSVPKATLADVVRMGERQSPVLMRLSLQDGKADLSGAYPVGNGGRILAPLDADETILLSMLRGDAKMCILTVDGVTTRVRDVCAKVTLSDDLRTARVALTMTALSSDLSQEALAQACAELLSRLSADGCDALGLGRKLAVRVRDLQEWQALNWPERLRAIRWEAAVRVDVPA